MKKLILLAIAFVFISFDTEAQGVKKYATLEHFTNTRCSICAGRNSAMFSTIANYPDKLHHIAYHPSVPYTTCVFYQHNTSGNNARALYYDILGTPRIAINGTMQSLVGSALLPETNLTAAFNQLSPIEVVVSETEGTTRSVTVEVKTHGDAPVGNLRLLVAVAEKIVNYNAPNGESVHHNVFRTFLSDNAGDVYSPAASGESVLFNYTYEINAEWGADQAYVLAYVQDMDTGEIYNSGTKFDEVLTSNVEVEKNEVFTVFPNPTMSSATINFTTQKESKSTLSILNTAGQLIDSKIISTNTQAFDLDLENYPKGLYFLKIENEDSVAIKRLVKN